MFFFEIKDFFVRIHLSTYSILAGQLSSKVDYIIYKKIKILSLFS